MERCRGRIRYIPVGEGRYSAELGDDPAAAKAARHRRVENMADNLRKQGFRMRDMPDRQAPRPPPEIQAPQPPEITVCCPACGHMFPFPGALPDGGSDIDIALSILSGAF